MVVFLKKRVWYFINACDATESGYPNEYLFFLQRLKDAYSNLMVYLQAPGRPDLDDGICGKWFVFTTGEDIWNDVIEQSQPTKWWLILMFFAARRHPRQASVVACVVVLLSSKSHVLFIKACVFSFILRVLVVPYFRRLRRLRLSAAWNDPTNFDFALTCLSYRSRANEIWYFFEMSAKC